MKGTKQTRRESGMGRQERFLWQAAVAALSVHVLVLGALAQWGALPPAEGTRYAEVDFVDFVEPERTMTMEEAVRERMEARMEAVRNVAADAGAARSSDLRSTTVSEEALARDVEAELRAFEQSAFDALADGRDDAVGAETNSDDRRDEVRNDYEDWNARYDGQVTAEYDLQGRKALTLDVPGYRCRGGGVVVVAIVVVPGGEVVDARIVSATGPGGVALEECLAAESLRSAVKCRFRSDAAAPKRQEGTLTYRFIAQ